VHRLGLAPGRIAVDRYAEQRRVQPEREPKRSLILDRPCRADEVRHATLEERLGEAGSQVDVAMARSSGVTPDSKAFEKMNFGMRSTRRSSLALRRSSPVKIQPDRDGIRRVERAVPGEVQDVVRAVHQLAQHIGAFAIRAPASSPPAGNPREIILVDTRLGAHGVGLHGRAASPASVARGRSNPGADVPVAHRPG
jgi:hypothetical protein